MPSASAFDRHFSPDEQRSLARWLDDHPHITVDAFRELLAERGLLVARSTAGEAKRRLERVGERLREGNRMMDTIAEGLEGKDDSQRFRALLEMGRSLCFDFQMAALESDDAMEVADLQKLTRGLHDLMKAAHHNQVAGEAGRKEARREAAEAADALLAKAEAEAEKGDPMAAIRRVREEIYGIVDEPRA